MPITIKRRKAPQTLTEFLEEHNLELVVEENDYGFIASLRGFELKDGGVLHSVFGKDKTPVNAVLKLLPQIVYRQAVIHAMDSENRKVFYVPELVLDDAAWAQLEIEL